MVKVKYPSLNGLRAFSIIFVVLNHLQHQLGAFNYLAGIKILQPIFLFITDGHFGVNVFFVISGFLITSLLLQEEANTKTISIKKFYTRRILRIFPAYYFLLLVYFILQQLGYIYIPGVSWLRVLTYTKYFNVGSEWYTGHAWSLSVEENFYLVWPFLFIAGKRVRKIACFFFVLVVPCIRTFIYFHPIPFINNFSIFTRVDAIATGCLFALYKDEIIKTLSKNWIWVFRISAVILLFLRFIPGIFIKNKIHLGIVNQIVGAIFIPLGVTSGTIANILIGVVMLYAVFGPRGFFFKILNWRVMNYIGLLSYSIYLWQQIFLIDYKKLPWINYGPVNIPLEVLLICCASLFSYYIIEKPFLRLKKRF